MSDDVRAHEWNRLTDSDDARLREIARRLYAEPAVRVYYPYASLHNLRISRNCQFPWDKSGLPFIVSETDGTYSAREGDGRPHVRGTVDDAARSFLELLAGVRASARDFLESVREGLERGATFDQLMEFVRDHKAAGLGQRETYDALRSLMLELRAASNERDEDLVTDMMDFVGGACPPHAQVWDTVLTD